MSLRAELEARREEYIEAGRAAQARHDLLMGEYTARIYELNWIMSKLEEDAGIPAPVAMPSPARVSRKKPEKRRFIRGEVMTWLEHSGQGGTAREIAKALQIHEVRRVEAAIRWGMDKGQVVRGEDGRYVTPGLALSPILPGPMTVDAPAGTEEDVPAAAQ